MKLLSKLLTKKTSWLFPWGLIALFIAFVAVWFRFWQLGQNPSGMSWDEAYLGYVGKMMIETRRDDFGRFLPVVFESFGDFKAPLAVYLTGISTTIFGLSPWAVRLPFAVFGLATVAVVGGILGARTKSWAWSLLGAWLLTTLPWHIHFSRIGFEAGIALFGFALFLLGWQVLRDGEASLAKRMSGWASITLGVWIALYVYHSSKVVLPLAALAIGSWEIWFQAKIWRKRILEIVAASSIATIGLIPFMWGVLNGGLNRASQTLFWHSLLPNETIWQKGIENLTSHLGPGFWIFGATDTLRHGNGVHGVATITMVLALIAGTAWLLWKRQPSDDVLPLRRNSKAHTTHTDLWLWAVLTLIGLLPAVLGADVPHPNRALLAAVPFIVLLTLTLRLVWRNLQGNTRQLVMAIVLLFSALETARYWQNLTLHYAADSSAAWLDGTREVSWWAATQASRGSSVAMTTATGEPDIFFAFVTDWPYDRYRWYDFGNVRFVEQNSLADSGAQYLISILEIDHLDYTLLNIVPREDGLPAYLIYVRSTE